MANYNLSARKKKGYNFNDDRRSKLYNYIAARDSKKEDEQLSVQPTDSEKEEKVIDENLIRGLKTVADVAGNFSVGFGKGIEGIVDAVIGLGGAVGGIFDEDIRDGAQRLIAFDAAGEWIGSEVERKTEGSFLNGNEIGEIVESVASGLGQMLPAVLVTIATGGAGASAAVAQGAGLATTGVSAAGSGMEEAYKDGAGYYEGLGYGVASGATEVATEKLFGGLTSKITGKGILDVGGEVAEQGLKRVVKGALEEGVEEVASHAVNPLTKTIYKGKDALKEYADPEYYKEGGKAFITGAGTGMVYGGTIGKAINKASGTNEDISASVESIESIDERLVKAQDGGNLTDDIEKKAAESRLENLKNIEKSLQKASERIRERYIRNYQLDNTFNEDGSLKPEILAREDALINGVQTVANAGNDENSTADQLDRRYYSVNLRGSEDTIRSDLADMSTDSETIKPFTGELSENAQKNFIKMKKALTTLNKHRGESVSFVIVDANNKFNGAERRGDTIYIAADALEGDAAASYLDEESLEANYAGTMLHEYGHTIEGTEEHAALNSFLAEDEELYADAVNRVLGQEYGITDEEIRRIIEKRSAGDQLTPGEQKKLNTFYSEVGATMSEQLLGNERVIRKLVREGDPLVDRVISWAENVKKTLSGKGEKFTLAEKRRMDKALKLYLKAAEAAGNRDLVKRILALREEDEDDAILTDESYTDENTENQPSNDHKTENMKVSEETRYSYKAPAESKVYKQIAEWEKLKVYEKADAEKMLYTILSDVMTFSEDQTAVMTLEGRKKAEQLLWAELNKAQSEKEMKKGADKVADFLISRSVVKSWLNDPYEAEKINAAEEALSNLKPYLHNLDLSHLKGEIKHKYDTKAKSVMLMWGTRRSGHGVDQIISELNSEMKGYGFPVDASANEADLFFAIHEAYTKARKELNAAYENYRDRTLTAEERDKLKAEISAKILDTYKTAGRESVLANATRIFKAELWKADQRVEYMRQYSVLVAKVDAFKQLTMGKFVNANTYHPDLFNGSVEQLKRIVRGGMISVKSTRDAVGKLAQWYRPDNPVVGEANYDASISSKMGQVADGGLSNYAGKKIDIKDLLEPYMHRIDLSGIKDRLREIYGEEMRSILATWNIKEGLEPVSLEEISSVLSKEGLDVYGDDFELFCQMESMYRSGVGPFSAEDLKNLSDIVAYFTKFVKNFNKVWNGKRYVEAEPIAKKHIQTIRENTKIKLGAFDKLMFGRYGSTFFRPETLARRLDMYGEGFYTETLHEFRQGLIQANDYEHQMMEAVAEFDKKHKHYFSELAKRRIEFRGNKIPADIAMSLYMTSKRRQAQAGLARSGFKYNDGKDTVDVQGYMPQKTPGGVEIGAERMQKLLWDEFSTEDREFIKIAESLFNGMCKQLKHDTDMSTKGYSNTVDGYYYPIKRAFVAKSVDSDFEDLMGRASNKSFNKDTVIGAKGVLCIMPMTEVLGRHVRGVAQYASLATVVRNYDTLYNLDIGENANDPTSIAREGEKLWKEGGDYYKKLLADMQGIGEKQSALLSVIRGNYATYQLGGNPKTWVTQLSSFFASTSMLKYGSVTRGMGINGSDVDEYCVLAKLRNANNDAILAQANANKPGLLKKRTKIGEISRKVSDTLMAPIGVVDRFVITKLFGACQAEIEARGGAKVGTKENKTEAGKLLEDVIIHTQQNSLATERSAAMRGGDLLKSLAMFSADGMNVDGQMIDAIGEIFVLKARIKTASDKDKAKLESQLKQAQKKATAAVSSLVTSAVFMSCIGLLFNFLYHRIDEEDDAGDIALDFTTDAIGNMLGGLPVLRDIYSYFNDGYEVKNYLYSVINDTLDAAASARDLAVSAFSDDFDSRKAAQTARKVIYAGGQLLGIPTRNLYNVTYSILGFIPSVKYGIDNMFYEQAYSSDLKKAVEAGDEGAIATITGIMTGERVGDIKDDKVRAELNDLTLKGYSVLPKAIADSVTVGEETVELTNTQKKQFKEIYSIANDSVTELMALKQYKNATDEIKAKAIKMIYDIYYQLAMDDVVGGTEANKNVLFAEAISVEKLAIIIATCRSIEADKNKKGVTISGSKKKKIEKYIQSLNLTAVQKYMIMGYLGYKNTNGETSVKSYIGKLNLTKEEKAELLKYSGY